MPCREVRSSHEENNTTSETDVPVGQGLRYPPQVFMDPEYAAAVPQMEEEEEQSGNNKFFGKYSEFCARSVVRRIASAIPQMGKKGY